MVTVKKILTGLKEFKSYENKGFPLHLKSFKSKLDWIKKQNKKQ